ncbi:hypothetical protein HDU86_006929 [Geranomyces michiganensis]|nr:hypothetical protein HDU86_006929 [Geranomyces michiganensis]
MVTVRRELSMAGVLVSTRILPQTPDTKVHRQFDSHGEAITAEVLRENQKRPRNDEEQGHVDETATTLPCHRTPELPKAKKAKAKAPSKTSAKSSFTLPTPLDLMNTPFKPKLTNAIVRNLEKTVLLSLAATADRVALPDSTKEALAAELEQQRSVHSLRSFPETRAALMTILRCDSEWEGWEVRFVAVSLPKEAAPADAMLWKMLRIALVQRYAVLSDGAQPVSHERTTWIDKVIPWFSPLRISGLVRWKWCEAGYGARVLEVHANNDYAARSTKLADGLGLVGGTAFESILVESSGDEAKENVTHVLGDSFKLIEKTRFIRSGKYWPTATVSGILGPCVVGLRGVSYPAAYATTLGLPSSSNPFFRVAYPFGGLCAGAVNLRLERQPVVHITGTIDIQFLKGETIVDPNVVMKTRIPFEEEQFASLGPWLFVMFAIRDMFVVPWAEALEKGRFALKEDAKKWPVLPQIDKANAIINDKEAGTTAFRGSLNKSCENFG